MALKKHNTKNYEGHWLVTLPNDMRYKRNLRSPELKADVSGNGFANKWHMQVTQSLHDVMLNLLLHVWCVDEFLTSINVQKEVNGAGIAYFKMLIQQLTETTRNLHQDGWSQSSCSKTEHPACMTGEPLYHDQTMMMMIMTTTVMDNLKFSQQ